MLLRLLLLLLPARRDVTRTASRAWATTTHAACDAATLSKLIHRHSATPRTENRPAHSSSVQHVIAYSSVAYLTLKSAIASAITDV